MPQIAKQKHHHQHRPSSTPVVTCSIRSLFVLVVVIGTFLFCWNLGQFNFIMCPDDFADFAESLFGTESALSRWEAMSKIQPHRPIQEMSTPPPQPALIPFDLSINHLSVIHYSSVEGGKLPTQEDFLPIVPATTTTPRGRLPQQGRRKPQLRFRLRPRPNCSTAAMQGISAYAIVTNIGWDSLWNSGKVSVPYQDAPTSVEWAGPPLKAGMIVSWQVYVWDALGKGPSTAASRFGVGPASNEDWTADWITHPMDLDTLFIDFNGTKYPRQRKWAQNRAHRQPNVETCQQWQQRLPLPLARVEFEIESKLASALLVASGLGMFAVTLNGKLLSSTSVHDPPLTDFTQRVPYRGFDVTHELGAGHHAIGISLGAGWWDHRPINGAIVFMDFMAKGSLTAICQLHVTYRNGTQAVLIPTGADGGWTMGKGPLLESNLYTGEAVNLAKKKALQGWDTVGGGGSSTGAVTWVTPVSYTRHVQLNSTVWRQRLESYAVDNEEGVVDAAAPIGELVPLEMPPVMPIRKLPVVSVVPLDTDGGTHSGRWLLDFGKALSGVVRFEEGLPPPIVPNKYPRAHDMGPSVWHNPRGVAPPQPPHYVTVVYGDSVELTTGDINLALVAGFGHHAGGERNESKPYDLDQRGGVCFPQEDLLNYQALTQRDAYVVPAGSSPAELRDLFATQVRQPQFAIHGFRYAEVCCTKDPPTNAYAVQYRTAYSTWGRFDSSNPVLNGAYEMTRNAIESNTVGLQSDCPHRERLQYGGDLISSSPAAMHMFDMSAFYAKVIRDWTVSQFSNGAYTVTSTFMDLLPSFSITKKGAGDPVWASVAPVLTARHWRHYGDVDLAQETLQNHAKWVQFLRRHWDAAAKVKYPPKEKYNGGGTGLGDWLAIHSGDGWIANHAFYLASARSVAYLASHLLLDKSDQALKPHDAVSRHAYYGMLFKAVETARNLEETIQSVYKSESFSYQDSFIRKMGQDLGLYARVVPGPNRCTALQSWLRGTAGNNRLIWSGGEEVLFHKKLRPDEYGALLATTGEERGGPQVIGRNGNYSLYTMRRSVTAGVLGIRYMLKTLSDLGHHTTALTKASGKYFPGYGSMLSWNATTLWETWWRSEDVYSRNHPMFGAVAEWLAEAVAGLALSPTTSAGRTLQFWPRIPTTLEAARIVHQASASQGLKCCGQAAIAWKLLLVPDQAGTKKEELDDENDRMAARREMRQQLVQNRQVTMRLFVPPGATAELKLPTTTAWDVMQSNTIPDLDQAQRDADAQCQQRRTEGRGFPFFWHYNRHTEQFYRVHQGQRIGTPCESFLFLVSDTHLSWKPYATVAAATATNATSSTAATTLQPGFYHVRLARNHVWQLKPDSRPLSSRAAAAAQTSGECADPSTFAWDLHDAEHLI